VDHAADSQLLLAEAMVAACRCNFKELLTLPMALDVHPGGIRADGTRAAHHRVSCVLLEHMQPHSASYFRILWAENQNTDNAWAIIASHTKCFSLLVLVSFI
jgi:hypothetical protein